MKKSVFILFLLSFFLGYQEKTRAQNISNEGTDFWAVFPTHVPSGNALARMSIFISSKSNSSGTVSIGATVIPFTVLANTIAEVEVPRPAAYINDTEFEKVLSNRGIHVKVDNGKPKVAVYAHIYARARSEAYLVLPVEAHGRKYYAMSTSGASAPNTSTINGVNGIPLLVVLATADNTNLIIKRKDNEGVVQRISLPKQGDVYEILSSSDLTGTSIEIDEPSTSCKTFAVYSGHSGVALFSGSYDPLLQQLYPINSWGRTYGIVPFYKRNHFTKIMASQDNTTVKLNGVELAKLNQGEVYTTDIEKEFVLVTADKPISIAMFALSQDFISASPGETLNGDPDMVILNPIEYNIKDITVFSSNLEVITSKYINIFMKTASRSSFKINGTAPVDSWVTVPSDPNYSFIQIEVFDKSLTLTANDGFNAIAYGFGDHESYAYSAGTNLATTKFLLLQNKVTNQETTAACLGQASDFKLTLPYQLTKLVWKLEDGTILYNDQNPNPQQKVVDGQTLYVYTAPVGMVFNTVGQFKLFATATLTSSECFSGDLDINFIVDVDPLPTAGFSFATEGCADQEITFKDISTSNVTQKQITRWLWDFGDGETSTAQNPKHIYATSGVFTVKLYVGAENGCLSDVITKDIIISPKVTALFNSKNISCVNTAISFSDVSTVDAPGKIIKWIWDMGDGKPTLIKTNSSPFNYQYATEGKYVVSLIAESDKGCQSMAFTKELVITALPAIDFNIPAVCLADAQAIFLNNSTDFDETNTNLTYLWNFGDDSSGVLNASTEKDGKHKYNAQGNYTITLTVFNANGCSATLTKAFTVNGSFPKAGFEVLNEESLCSNQSFSLKNKSTVNFGNVTKVEWFIDGVKYSEDNTPTPDKIYVFDYPKFSIPLIKTITVKMIAYSGGTCSDETLYQVNLMASPVVEFEAIVPICLNIGNIQMEAKETGGLSGSFIYTGNGVSSSGLFDPLAAGVGTHLITATFTAVNGCTDTKTQNITVYPIPSVFAGDDIYILAGGEKKLEATAKGIGMTYKWSPAIGLDRADVLNPTASPEKDIIYTLTVTSNQGCMVSDQVYVHVLENVNAPNSFSPNGDGVNDVWNVKYLDTYPKATVEIFNRNGERIFFSNGYPVPFDGNYKNQALPVGTYYYIINPNSGRKRITGNLTIIR